MGLHQIKSPNGARRNRRRRGLGDAAGQGSNSGRGLKGQKKRGSVSPFFEGGQLKLIKRLPYMRGFTNVFRVEYVGVNLDRLSEFGENAEVTPETLVARGFVNKPDALLKILGTGEAPRGIKVSAHAFSAAAKSKIEAAGGTVTVLGAKPVLEVESQSIHARAKRAKASAAKKATAQEEPKSESGKDS